MDTFQGKSKIFIGHKQVYTTNPIKQIHRAIDPRALGEGNKNTGGFHTVSASSSGFSELSPELV